MKVKTFPEIIAMWSSIIGGAITAMTLQAFLGLLIGVGGLAATWWLTVKRNEREEQRRVEEAEEHALKVAAWRKIVAMKDTEISRAMDTPATPEVEEVKVVPMLHQVAKLKG